MAAVAALLACGAADVAPAAPETDMVIRLGAAIGKIELGMTPPQVRRAFGRPHVTVYRRADFGARGRYLELGWELPGRNSWEPVLWQVGFRSTSRRAPLRVTRIATTARRERTPQRIGIGSRLRDVVRAYPSARCVTRFFQMPHPHTWVVVPGRGGMTAFQVVESRPASSVPTPFFVNTVMVQRQWFSTGAGHDECPPNWRG